MVSESRLAGRVEPSLFPQPKFVGAPHLPAFAASITDYAITQLPNLRCHPERAAGFAASRGTCISAPETRNFFPLCALCLCGEFFLCYDVFVKFVVFLLLSAAALAQTSSSKPARPAPQAAPAAPQSPAPDDGFINGQLYTSKYFSFSYTLPAHLEVDDNFVNGQQDASRQTFVLLAAYGPAPEGNRREGVVLMADRATSPGTAWADVYFQTVSRVLVAQGAQPVGAMREYSFGGQQFFRRDFARSGSDPAFQSLLVTRRRGCVLAFNFVATAEAAANKLVESLNSIHFEPAAKANTKPSN